MAPYSTFSLICTATSRVEGVGNVALPKRFLWRRQYGPDTLGLTQLSNNATIQIQDGDNLNQPTSSSILTVTEDSPGDYRYHCRVDLDLATDDIFTFTDVYPIRVTGKCCSSEEIAFCRCASDILYTIIILLCTFSAFYIISKAKCNTMFVLHTYGRSHFRDSPASSMTIKLARPLFMANAQISNLPHVSMIQLDFVHDKAGLITH